VNDIIRTPNFDRIASEGVLFRNAFVSSPSCTPCRSALVSGRHFWQTGSASILRSTWDFSQPAFPLILKENGYHIGMTYKGWSPGEPNNAPFGGREARYQNSGGKFSTFSQTITDLVKKGTPLDQAKETLYTEVRKNFDQFISARSGDEPFFYLFGPTNTHREWIKGSGKSLWNLDPEALKGKLPPFLPDVEEIRQDFADYLGEAQAVDAGIGVIYNRLKESGELENTIIIISGDHGAPGFPHGKVNLYDFGTRVPLAIRFGKNIKAGRTVDRLTSLIDIAPTILEAAGIKIPEEMTGKSLFPVLTGKEPGTSSDEAVFTGRERHVPPAREGNLPYPQRAIRTKDHLFIINFEPDRWPTGDPRNISKTSIPSQKELEHNTRITLADEDAGPTKAWMVQHRDDYSWKKYYEGAYGKRPRYELYDLKKDPDQVENLSGKPDVSEIEAALRKRLMAELTRTSDPRVTGDKLFYETAPMTDAE
jgi:arylsulfatase A-like enzyme